MSADLQLAELERLVAELGQAYDRMRADLVRQAPQIDPLQMRDTAGRYILADLLVAHSSAHIALMAATDAGNSRMVRTLELARYERMRAVREATDRAEREILQRAGRPHAD